ncbi:hypothetical protein ACFSCZ_06365 [Siminovitchia sediminis]|uniref:Glyoxalase n=1 Tax=Siminovitchia sediminis TaxID=1274353 RepID=A0ABW4KH67_9BACI
MFKINAVEFVNDTYKHYKTIGVTKGGSDLFEQFMGGEGSGYHLILEDEHGNFEIY